MPLFEDAFSHSMGNPGASAEVVDASPSAGLTAALALSTLEPTQGSSDTGLQTMTATAVRGAKCAINPGVSKTASHPLLFTGAASTAGGNVAASGGQNLVAGSTEEPKLADATLELLEFGLGRASEVGLGDARSGRSESVDLDLMAMAVWPCLNLAVAEVPTPPKSGGQTASDAPSLLLVGSPSDQPTAAHPAAANTFGAQAAITASSADDTAVRKEAAAPRPGVSPLREPIERSNFAESTDRQRDLSGSKALAAGKTQPADATSALVNFTPSTAPGVTSSGRGIPGFNVAGDASTPVRATQSASEGQQDGVPVSAGGINAAGEPRTGLAPQVASTFPTSTGAITGKAGFAGVELDLNWAVLDPKANAALAANASGVGEAPPPGPIPPLLHRLEDAAAHSIATRTPRFSRETGNVFVDSDIIGSAPLLQSIEPPLHTVIPGVAERAPDGIAARPAPMAEAFGIPESRPLGLQTKLTDSVAEFGSTVSGSVSGTRSTAVSQSPRVPVESLIAPLLRAGLAVTWAVPPALAEVAPKGSGTLALSQPGAQSSVLNVKPPPSYGVWSDLAQAITSPTQPALSTSEQPLDRDAAMLRPLVPLEASSANSVSKVTSAEHAGVSDAEVEGSVALPITGLSQSRPIWRPMEVRSLLNSPEGQEAGAEAPKAEPRLANLESSSPSVLGRELAASTTPSATRSPATGVTVPATMLTASSREVLQPSIPSAHVELAEEPRDGGADRIEAGANNSGTVPPATLRESPVAAKGSVFEARLAGSEIGSRVEVLAREPQAVDPGQVSPLQVAEFAEASQNGGVSNQRLAMPTSTTKVTGHAQHPNDAVHSSGADVWEEPTALSKASKAIAELSLSERMLLDTGASARLAVPSTSARPTESAKRSMMPKGNEPISGAPSTMPPKPLVFGSTVTAALASDSTLMPMPEARVSSAEFRLVRSWQGRVHAIAAGNRSTVSGAPLATPPLAVDAETAKPASLQVAHEMGAEPRLPSGAAKGFEREGSVSEESDQWAKPIGSNRESRGTEKVDMGRERQAELPESGAEEIQGGGLGKEHSVPSANPRRHRAGIPVAKEDLMQARPIEGTHRTETSAPGRIHFAGQTSIEGSDSRGNTFEAQTSVSRPPASEGVLVWDGKLAERPEVVAAKSPVGKSTGIRPIPELAGEILQHASQARDLKLDSMIVVLRTDSETQIALQLVRVADAIEVKARIERGDLATLSHRWSELQQTLAAQGVRLHDFEAKGRSGGSSEQPATNSGSPEDAGGHARQQARRQDTGESLADGTPARRGSPARVTRARGRAGTWELWA